MRRPLLAVMWIALAVGGLGALGAAVGPRLTFGQVTFNFGAIYQGDVVTHRFAFRNTGDAPLKLGKISTSCGCTAASSAGREIAPTQTGVVSVTLRSNTLRDRVLKHVYVESNDAAAPRVTLTLEGVVRREVEVLPPAVYVPAAKVGESVTREVRIRPAETKRFRILGSASDQAAITVSDPQPIRDQQGGYRLAITVQAQPKPARISATVTIRTDLPHARELQVPVYARVAEKSSGSTADPPAPR